MATALSVSALAQTPAPTQEMLVGMDISIGADGKVVSAEPDAKLPEGIRTLARHRVMQWQYKPAMWQGKPVATKLFLVLRLAAAPTTAGGFVLRIVGTGGESELDTGYGIEPPKYPRAAQVANKSGNFIYVIDFDPEGRATQARLVEPQEATLDKYGRMMAEAGLATAKSAHVRPFNVDGVAVECEWVFPIMFGIGVTPTQTSEEEERMKALRAQLPRACPEVRLETKIENTLL